MIFHQNIYGLLNKKDELLNPLTQTQPQIICRSEHHLSDEELEGTTLHSYTLGAKFYRREHKCGGVCNSFRIIYTILTLILIDTPMKRIYKFVL
jgi:hypothetical protein